MLAELEIGFEGCPLIHKTVEDGICGLLWLEGLTWPLVQLFKPCLEKA